MLIEGNILIGILVGLAIAIALAVVIIRYALKKDPNTGGSAFSWPGRNRDQATTDADADAEAHEEPGAVDPMAGQFPDDGLSLPSLDELSDPFVEVPQTAVPAASEKSNPASAGLGSVIKDLIGTLLAKRKKPEEVKRDVQDIDEQLNQVLQESQNLGLDIPSSVRVPDLGMMSDSQNMRNIDKEIRNQNRAAEIRRPEPTPAPPQSIEGLNPYTQGGSLELNPPGMSPAPNAPDKPQEQAKPDLSKQPQGPKPDAKGPENAFSGGGANDLASDLLSEIAADSVKVVEVDLAIMKDLKDVPLVCDELEKDLTGILDQISLNAKVNGKKTKSASGANK